MLRLLRKKETAKKAIFWILITVTTLAFVLWGAGAYKEKNKTPNFAGMIFKHRVSYREYQKARLACANNARLRFGDYYSKIEAYLNLDYQAWVRLILLDYAKKERIKVSDKEVVEQIASIPFFVKGGRFSNEIYKTVVRRYLNVQPRDFEEQVRADIIINKIYEMAGKDVKVNDDELRQAYQNEFEETGIDYIKVSPEEFKQKVTVSDDEIKGYYEKNKDYFKRPQTVKVEHIGIPYAPDASSNAKQQAFDKLRFSYQRIKNAKDLKSVAQEPLVYKQTGFFSSDEPIEGIGFSANFSLYAFSLKENETSPIIQTPEGAYVLRVIEKKLPYIMAFNDVKEKIKAAIIEDKSLQEAKDKIQEYKNRCDAESKLDPAFDLKKAATLLGVEVKSSGLFKRSGRIADINDSKAIIDEAFKLKPKQISGIIAVPQGYFVIEQEKLVNIDEARFKAEKEAYSKKVLDQKKQEKINAFIEELIKKSGIKDYIGATNTEE